MPATAFTRAGTRASNAAIEPYTTLLMVKEFTAVKDVAEGVEAIEGASELVEGTSNATKTADVVESTSNATKTADVVEEATTAAKSWRDPELNPSEAWKMYKSDAPSGKLSWNEFQSKFADGWRFNPENSRWMKPDLTALGEGTGGVSGTANVAADASKIEAATQGVKTAVENLAKGAEEALGTAEKLAGSVEPEAAELGRSLRSTVHEVLEHSKLLEGFEHAELAVMRTTLKLMSKLETLLAKTHKLAHVLKDTKEAKELLEAADWLHRALHWGYEANHAYHELHELQHEGHEGGGHEGGGTPGGTPETHGGGHGGGHE